MLGREHTVGPVTAQIVKRVSIAMAGAHPLQPSTTYARGPHAHGRFSVQPRVAFDQFRGKQLGRDVEQTLTLCRRGLAGVAHDA